MTKFLLHQTDQNELSHVIHVISHESNVTKTLSFVAEGKYLNHQLYFRKTVAFGRYASSFISLSSTQSHQNHTNLFLELCK